MLALLPNLGTFNAAYHAGLLVIAGAFATVAAVAIWHICTRGD